MLCPFCHRDSIVTSKMKGYYTCVKCGTLYNEKLLEDKDNSKDYRFETMRSKDTNPSIVFDKASSMFNNGSYIVVGIKLEKGDYSFTEGQNYTIIKMKR